MRNPVLSFVSVGAIALASTFATAADLPSRAPPPVFVPPAPFFTWTGFYVGLNAGAGFPVGNTKNSYNFAKGSIRNSGGTNGALTLNGTKNGDPGFVGGGQIGYNYQLSPNGFVIGVEADIQFIDLKSGKVTSSNNYTFRPVGIAFGQAFLPPRATVSRPSVNFDYFGTARGRIGYAFDRLLIFGTGGLAFAGGGKNNNGANGNNNDDNNFGFAAGGGGEYAFTDHLSLKIEGLYVNLDTKKRADTATYNAAARAGGIVTLNGNRTSEFVVGRVGLNYRF